MIKNNRKKIVTYLLIIAITFIASIGNVEASAIVSTTPSAYETGSTNKINNSSNNGSTQTNSCFTSGKCYGNLSKGNSISSSITYGSKSYSYMQKNITINGTTYDALCIDPQNALPSDNAAMVCSKLSDRTAKAYAFAEVISDEYNLNELELDFVYRAISITMGNGTSTTLSSAISQYINGGYKNGTGLSGVSSNLRKATIAAVNSYKYANGRHSGDPEFTFKLTKEDYDNNIFTFSVSADATKLIPVPDSSTDPKVKVSFSVDGYGKVTDSSFDPNTGEGTVTVQLYDSKYCSNLKITTTVEFEYVKDGSYSIYSCTPSSNTINDAQRLIIDKDNPDLVAIPNPPSTETRTRDFTTTIDEFCQEYSCSTIPSGNVTLNGKSTTTKKACEYFQTNKLLKSGVSCNVVSSLDSKWYSDGNKYLGTNQTGFEKWVDACTKPDYSCEDIPKGKTTVNGKKIKNITLCEQAKEDGIYSGECKQSDQNNKWYDDDHNEIDGKYTGWLKVCANKTTDNSCKVPSNKKTYCENLKETRDVVSCDTSSDGKWYDKDGNASDSKDDWLDTCTSDKTEEKHYCEVVDDVYYDKEGNGSTDPTNYKKQCLSCSVPEGEEDYCESTGRTDCNESSDDPSHWHDSNGDETDKNGWKDSCTNPDTTTNTCQTSITTPEICDDASDKTIEIESPDDVNSCIIGKSDDAGDSYQDTKVTSRYCTIYCKEDYEITLPGAQYTTSGRYFSVNSVKVDGTRTCYAAGPNGETTGIAVSKYNSDVVANQKLLVFYYNQYSRLKAIIDNKGNATKSTSGCSNEYTSYSLTFSYNTYDVVCNDTNCTLTSGGTKTETITWGQTASKSEVQADTVGKTYTTESRKNTLESQGYQCDETTKKCTREYSCRSTNVNSTGNEPTQADLNSALSNLNSTNTTLRDIIGEMQNCYNFGENYTINPEIGFSYDEKSYSGITFEFKNSNEESKTETQEYGTKVDSEYNISNKKSLQDIGYIKCTNEGCTNEGTEGNRAYNISTTATYAKVTINKVVSYSSSTQLATNYPHGTIEKVTDKSKLKYNYSYLGAVFPVAMTTNEGVYKWQLNITNLGQSSDGSTGRIDKIAKNLGVSVDSSIQYVCVYAVDCDDCEYTCKCPAGSTNCTETEKTCTFDDKPTCTDCEVYCKNCIFNGDTTYTYRTVSLNNLFPNTSRTIGSNWSSDKGQATAKAISDTGEDAYITPEYSFTLTATNMQNIRNYNSTTGTYVDEDLTYTEVTVNGVTYYVGKSNFLRNDNNNLYFENAKLNNDWTSYSGTITDGSGPAWK
jgi:hypothetical protein